VLTDRFPLSFSVLGNKCEGYPPTAGIDVPTALIIGSGPSAAGTAMALSRRRDLEIVMIDLGLELEPDRQNIIDGLASQSTEHWDPSKVAQVSAPPVDSEVRGLPEKRAYGSDFAFRDIGQLRDITRTADVNEAVVSAAYGGFSNVWGSQVMPFTNEALSTWPISGDEMEPHYRAILDEITFAGEEDDLAELFPLITEPTPLPNASERTVAVLRRYARHRTRLRRQGITLGRARLAFDASECVRCGLCLTGCPYSLIYSASTTIDRLRRAGRIAYHGNHMAVRVGEEGGRVFVWTREKGSDRLGRFEADRMYVACGGVGSTRLVVNSLGLFDASVTLCEAAQFVVPFVSTSPTSDPKQEHQFTLNQFNMLVSPHGGALDLAMLHFYTYNSAFDDAVPAFLRQPMARRARDQLFRRLSVAAGYLPSWASPKLRLRFRPPTADDNMAPLDMSRDEVRWRDNAMMRAVFGRLLRSAPYLDLWPVLPYVRFSGGAKSYHFGGSFPHQEESATVFGTDRLGRPRPWDRIHLVDATVFPSIPATTFTLTVMANAHRIASESLNLT
jgi:ferredoxin